MYHYLFLKVTTTPWHRAIFCYRVKKSKLFIVYCKYWIPGIITENVNVGLAIYTYIRNAFMAKSKICLRYNLKVYTYHVPYYQHYAFCVTYRFALQLEGAIRKKIILIIIYIFVFWISFLLQLHVPVVTRKENSPNRIYFIYYY